MPTISRWKDHHDEHQTRLIKLLNSTPHAPQFKDPLELKNNK